MVYRRFNLSYYSMIISVAPLAIFILSLINVKVKPVDSILNEIRASLNDYPLADFEYDKNCIGKYNGSIYTFPGSKRGCSCVEVDSYYYDQNGKYEVNPGECDTNQTRNGCKDLSSYPSQKLWNYKNDGKFCSKKYNANTELNGYLYYLNISVKENEKCQEGFKNCGKLDDMGNYLCFPKDDDCPVNEIIVSESQRPELVDYNVTSIKNTYFYYRNTANKSVITKLKVAEEKLCMDRTYFYTKYPQYILDNNFDLYGCRNKIEGELYSNSEDFVDKITKKSLYLNSPDIDIYFYNKSIFDYPFYSLEAEMILYTQRYIGYDKQCFIDNNVFDMNKSPFEENKIKEMNDYVSDTISKNKLIKWFSIICFILILIACAVFNLDKKDNTIFIWLWTLVCCCLYIWLAIPIYSNFRKIDKFKKFPLCGNKITNIKFDTYHSTANTLKTTSILSIIFLNLQLLFNIIIIVLRYTLQYVDDYNYEPENRKPLNQNYSSNIDYNKASEKSYYNNDSNKPPEEPYYNNFSNNKNNVNNENDPYYNSSDFNQNNHNRVSGVDNPTPYNYVGNSVY